MDILKTSKKIAIKADGNDLTLLRQIATTLLGASEIFDEQGTTALLTQDGTLLELYSSYSCFPEYLFANSNVVISYKVPDIAKAVEKAVSLGSHSLSGIVAVGEVMQYCHLSLPGGIVIGLYQENSEMPV